MPVIYTLGHSTRPSEELLQVLEQTGIQTVADVRRFPSSRRYPQYNGGELESALARRGIRYLWFGDTLGGRRKEVLPLDRSPNRAWQTPAFRNYADAMTTPEFLAGIEGLEIAGREAPTAFLCAEKVWWKCHRRLIADLLLVRGWAVVHLMDLGHQAEHRLSKWARVDGNTMTYPTLL
jgi:uncharacterized protein (DUF488 family)